MLWIAWGIQFKFDENGFLNAFFAIGKVHPKSFALLLVQIVCNGNLGKLSFNVFMLHFSSKDVDVFGVLISCLFWEKCRLTELELLILNLVG